VSFGAFLGRKLSLMIATVFLEKQAYVRLLKLLFCLGARISHLEAIETVGFYGAMAPWHPLYFILRWLGLLMFSNPRTNFEVATIICYEDMKGNAKCRNCGRFGQLGVTQGHLQCRHSIEHIQLPNRL